jgi:hypothetical protein
MWNDENRSTRGYTPDLLFCILVGKGLKVRSTLLVTNIALLVTNIALLVTNIALLVTNIALLVTNIALLVTNIALLVTNIALLVTNIAYLAPTPWKDTEQLMLGLTPLTFTLRLILQGRTLCRGAVLERK